MYYFVEYIMSIVVHYKNFQYMDGALKVAWFLPNFNYIFLKKLFLPNKIFTRIFRKKVVASILY